MVTLEQKLPDPFLKIALLVHHHCSANCPHYFF